jgi:hypothetical protein
MGVQAIDHDESRFRQPQPRRSGGIHPAALAAAAVRRLPVLAAAAANDAPMESIGASLSIAETIALWVAMNPPQSYRGGA